MDKANVLNFSNFLSNLKLNKFDKEIRAAIISNSLLSNRIVKEIEETIQEARKKYFEGIEDEVDSLVEYRKSFETASDEERSDIKKEIITKCSRALAAEAELSDFGNKLLAEEVDLPIVKIDRNSFVDQCSEADIDVTVRILEILEPLFN